MNNKGSVFIRRPENNPDPVHPVEELEEVDVALVMESTYPFLKGGVSAVVHDIIKNNPDLTFGIIHITWDHTTPLEDLYGMPFNVKWVDLVYLSLEESRDRFIAAVEDQGAMGWRTGKKVVDSLFTALEDITKDKPETMWQFYDEAISPNTRKYSMWPVIASRAMMEKSITLATENDDATLGSLLWLIRDFFSIGFSLLERTFPKARVYHSHTQGYASLVAACAARENDGAFFLTEHNLYVRDTINTMLERRLDRKVRRHSYLDLPRDTREKFWTRWWIEMGAFLYPSADHITYLYPAAIEDAKALGGIPERSEVLPNGMYWDTFEYGRARRAEVLPQILTGKKTHWRFCCIARVVPIKGIIELIDAAAAMRRRGYDNFVIEILGPTEHFPEYYVECVDHVRTLRLENIVIFRGTVRVNEIMHEYDALVLSSYNEGQPIVVLEAMACALPIVGTYVGGMDQVVEHPLPAPNGDMVGPCGILVEPGDTKGLADGMIMIMDLPNFYEQWSQSALLRLQGTFLMPMVMSRYNAIYRRLGAGLTNRRLSSEPLANRRTGAAKAPRHSRPRPPASVTKYTQRTELRHLLDVPSHSAAKWLRAGGYLFPRRA